MLRSARGTYKLAAVTGTAEEFHDLVSNLDYPMFVLTAASEGQRSGCLVGFATQASLEPPRLLVAVSKANHTYRVARRAGALGVHFLKGDDLGLARLFGEETGDEVDKFASCDWRDGPAGVPVLENAGGWVVGSVSQRFDFGDHVGHLLEPLAARPARGGGPQLGFQAVKNLSPGHPVG